MLNRLAVKRLVVASNFAFLMIVSSLQSAASVPQPVSAKDLRNQLELAMKARDTNSVVSLFCSNEVANPFEDSDALRQWTIMTQSTTLLQTNITKVELAPLPPNFNPVTIDEENGTVDMFNLDVVGLIDAKGPGGIVMELPYGEEHGVYYLAGIGIQKLSGKSLAIRVLFSGDPDTSSFTGTCTYVQNGKAIVATFDQQTNLFASHWGDYIKSVTIQRTSADIAWGLRFDIMEGDKRVFESPEITNEIPFIYNVKTNTTNQP